MRDTVHCLVEGEPDQAAITKTFTTMLVRSAKVRARLQAGQRPRVRWQPRLGLLGSRGPGRLPARQYAGNLDIMTAAAARSTAEMFAEEILAGKLTLQAV